MKAKLIQMWYRPLITIEGDTFTVGQCITTWGGIILFLIILNAACGMEWK